MDNIEVLKLGTTIISSYNLPMDRTGRLLAFHVGSEEAQNFFYSIRGHILKIQLPLQNPAADDGGSCWIQIYDEEMSLDLVEVSGDNGILKVTLPEKENITHP